jgi:hypothetical protein
VMSGAASLRDHNYFDSITKLFSDPYQTKLSDTLAKPSFLRIFKITGKISL